MRLGTTSIADTDVAQAAVWLDQTQPGLGGVFVDVVDATFTRIQDDPFVCPTLFSSTVTFKVPLRFKLVGRFPYRVFFTVAGDEVVVIAVLHSNRDMEAILQARVGIT